MVKINVIGLFCFVAKFISFFASALHGEAFYPSPLRDAINYDLINCNW